MPNNPLNTDGFRHFLNFKSLGFSQLYEITTPGGFDSENFRIQQNEMRFARDVVFGGDVENLRFSEGSFEKATQQQMIHPNGKMSEYLDMGLNWIFETIRRFRYDGSIERILWKDGVFFTVGDLELYSPDTDKSTYFGCRIVQNTKIASYKRQLTTSVDLFSTQDVNGDAITPAPTLNVLRRAVPVTATSQWSDTVPEGLAGVSVYTNHFFSFNRQIVQDKIRTTKVSVSDAVRYYDNGWRQMTFTEVNNGGNTWIDGDEGASMQLAEAVNLLTKIEVNVKLKATLRPLFDSGFEAQAEADFFYFVMVSKPDEFRANFNAGKFFKVFNVHYHKDDPDLEMDVDETFEMPVNVPIGEKLYGGYTNTRLPLNDDTAQAHTKIFVNESLVTITASELAIDTVIGSVRYIDAIKQCVKFINPTMVDAEIFDAGGEHYDNVVYNRALISTKANNSIELINTFNPEGNFIGQVVYNTNDTITGILPKGLYFWNGTIWIALDYDEIPQVYLTATNTPPGIEIGNLIFNTNPEVSPSGLAYWNGTDWLSLQYSKPFITTTQDCFESAMTIETCADYEITNDKISFLPWEKYYENSEIGAFMINPSRKLNYDWNPRAIVNNIKFDFDTYETNRLTKNSANDLHTEAEWSVPNKKVFEKFDRTIKYIRSGFAAQAMVDLETKSPQTADVNDDKVFIAKIIPLPTGSFNEFSAPLNLSWSDGLLQILNKTGEGETDNVVINWSIFGFSEGDQFFVTIDGVVREFNVVSITPTTVKLDPVGAATSENGDFNVVIKYFYTNVQWQTETNQNYEFISGLDNPDKTPNLDYTLRRIFKRWEGYFASMGIAHPDGIIRNLKYVNNPPLKSQRIDGELLVEKGTISFSEMPTPRISDETVMLEVYADFTSVLNLLNVYLTNRGFIRCYDLTRVIRGYFQDLDYNWKTGLLKLFLEIKFEPEITQIAYLDGVVSVNGTPYEIDGFLNWWKITNQNIELFDIESRLLTESRHFTEVTLNGNTFDNIDDFTAALYALNEL